AGSSATVAAVLSGELDLGIVTPPVAEATGAKPALIAAPLVEDELRLIVPARHAPAGKRRFRWEGLDPGRGVAVEDGAAGGRRGGGGERGHGAGVDRVDQADGRSGDRGRVRQPLRAGGGAGPDLPRGPAVAAAGDRPSLRPRAQPRGGRVRARAGRAVAGEL